jgi:DNA-binding NarL/FixJ family response regulator
MQKYKIIIVDDHQIFRMGLKLLLSMIPDVEVVAEAANGQEFLDLLGTQTADIVFMDLRMPIMNGVEATEKALKLFPELKIIALSSSNDSDNFDRMIYAGVEGYMLKNSNFNDFKTAIEKVTKGGNYFSEELLVNFTKAIISQKIRSKNEVPELSKREIEVLQLICNGFSNQKIGEKLNISSRTIERHKTNLITKTKTGNTVNLILYALRHKLVQID